MTFGVFAREMPSDHFIGNGKEAAVLAPSALDLGFIAQARNRILGKEEFCELQMAEKRKAAIKDRQRLEFLAKKYGATVTFP